MTECEKFLYKVIEAIVQTKSPIIFKEAMITKILLRDSINGIGHKTKDIDCDWIGDEVTMEQLNLIISKAVSTVGDFKMFLNGKEKIEHAYEKMTGIDNKPSFLEVYDRVCILIESFLLKEIDLVWSPSKWYVAKRIRCLR